MENLTTRWGRMITHCVSPEDTIILAADVKAEIRVSLKLLALKVNYNLKVIPSL